MVGALTTNDTGVLRSPAEVCAVGHRVVHGGNTYSHQVIITDEVLQEIEKASELAPVHNPVNLIGIHEAQRLFPDVPHVAVFDTAFHQVMPPYAYLYGLPYEYFDQKRIRRYGFHGTSHKYVSLKVAEHLKRSYNELEIIVCHLGNGASVCAIDHGRSVDTSMGLTPAEGLIMGTRCGDIDPAILVHLMRTEGLGHKELDQLINKQGGLKGLSGVSNDMREIEAAADAGNARALLAIKTFCYRVRKYIGAYVAAMGGLDVLAFTGGIGQGSVWARSLACQGLAPMGICLDEQKNRNARGFDETCDISAEGSSVRVLVVPTDEERMIARETLRALQRSHVAAILRGQTPMPVPIEISAHHVHLSQMHVEALFGAGYTLTPEHELSQPGQFACNEKVNLIGPRGRVENVRILGPTRKETQVEISMTEQFKLGIHPPIRESGYLEGTPGVTLEGSKSVVTIDRGVICALRHIHMTPEDALRMGLKDKDVVTVRLEGDRELTFGDVLVRVNPNYRLAMHLDTDEGNAANIAIGARGYVTSIQSRR
jgi:acetate kinase